MAPGKPPTATPTFIPFDEEGGGVYVLHNGGDHHVFVPTPVSLDGYTLVDEPHSIPSPPHGSFHEGDDEDHAASIISALDGFSVTHVPAGTGWVPFTVFSPHGGGIPTMGIPPSTHLLEQSLAAIEMGLYNINVAYSQDTHALQADHQSAHVDEYGLPQLSGHIHSVHDIVDGVLHDDDTPPPLEDIDDEPPPHPILSLSDFGL